jgi:hypothetical protein
LTTVQRWWWAISRSAATLRIAVDFAIVFSIAEEDEVPWIFRPTDSARVFQLLTMIEEQEGAGLISADKLSEAPIEMMHAHIICHQGQVLDAVAIYDAVAESVRPIRSGRAEIK